MYARIILIIVLFFVSTSAAFAGWHLENYNDLPKNVQDLVLQGKIKEAERAKEQWYKDTHRGKSVNYTFSVANGNLYIACTNGWDAYYPIP